jgi:hypothetical protein
MLPSYTSDTSTAPLATTPLPHDGRSPATSQLAPSLPLSPAEFEAALARAAQGNEVLKTTMREVRRLHRLAKRAKTPDVARRHHAAMIGLLACDAYQDLRADVGSTLALVAASQAASLAAREAAE